MTSAAASLLASAGEGDPSRWDAYWDPSADDEPYCLHWRDGDAWYRVEPEAVAEPGAEALGVSPPAAGVPASANRTRLAGRWAAGASAPVFTFVRAARRGSTPTEERLVQATTAAVVAAAVESLMQSGRLPACTAPGWRSVAVRLDG